MLLLKRLLSLATLAAALLFGGRAPAGPAPEGAPTFTRDIAPILFDKCASCHRPNQIGPFSLLTYADARKRATQIATVTEERVMPPWMPHPEWGEFSKARTLDDRQIAVLKGWSEAGTPEGNAADLPPLPKFKDGWQLGEPDLILKMPKPFVVPAEGRDVYVHFVFPLDFDKDKYLRGIEIMPGNRRVAHHAAGLLDASGTARKRAAKVGGSYTGNDPGFLPAGFTPGFVPGQEAAFFKEGEAITIKKGTDYMLQMHYHPVGTEQADQTMVGLYFTDQKPKRGLSMFLLGSTEIDMPPGEKAYKRSDAYRLLVDYEVRTIWAHMHLIGKQAKVWAELPDGTTRKMLWIDNWDFNWQDTYGYKQPFVLPKGTLVKAEFLWDNSADNPRNPFTPPQRIVEGEQSTNEMGGLIIGGLPVKPEEEWIHWLAVGGHYLGMTDKGKRFKEHRGLTNAVAAPTEQPPPPTPPAAKGPSSEPATAKEPSVVKQSDAARQAAVKHDKDLETARQEFEQKLQRLRQEYEQKASAARRQLVAGLKAAQAEETRRGRPEAARAVGEAAARAEAQGAPAWPKEVLPNDQVAAAGPGTGRLILAAKGLTFDFTDEKKIRELWTLPADPKTWQAMNAGLELHGVTSLESRFTWTGDATIQMTVDGHDLLGPPSIQVYGEDIKLPFGASTVVIERKGDQVIAKVNDKPVTFTIKESQKAVPTRLGLKFGGAGVFIKGIRITAKELLAEPLIKP